MQPAANTNVQQRVQRGRDVCETDLKRFCSKVVPGEGRIFACLDANKAAMVPDCRDKLNLAETLHARAEAIKAKIRAAQIKQGLKPDPLLDPTPIGQRPHQSSTTVHMPPPGKAVTTPSGQTTTPNM
jgi:hypothetical protein